ncbi:hypothetical protein MKX73_19080 [Solibacillus sp. FSL W7-1436]|uniref:hypothetical protein n=1 Tax=Solibacillus sp. FSL W7-1436 TaxID=2921705 RepID=UPI0030F5865F
MQILIVEPQSKYIDYLKANSDYDILHQDNIKLLSMDESDILIVDNQAADINELIQKKEYFNEYQYVFYIGQISKEDTVLAKINDIIPIETDEPQHVLSAIENLMKSQKNDRVFSFIAADRKAGNTSVIHSIAESLATNSTKEVIVLSLNNNYTEPLYTDVTLDQIKTSIISQRVTFDEILNIAKFNGKYAYIGTSKNIFDSSKYTAEQIAYFYSVLAEQDTHLVLLDLGADEQNPFHAVAFDYVHHMFLITRPTFNYQYSFNKKMEQIFEPFYKRTHKSFYTIINGVTDETNLSKSPYKVISKISFSEYGVEAENSHIPLHKLDSSFEQETSVIAKYIATLNGSYIETEEKNERFSMFGWMKKKQRLKEV